MLTVFPGVVVNMDPVVTTGPVPITLRGGEPGWMLNDLDPAGHSGMNHIGLPWSRVSIGLRNDAAGQRRIIGSMWSEPAKARVLALPGTVGVAELTMPDDQGRYSLAGYGRSTDPATIRAVLALLRTQRKTVSGADACAGPAQHGARLVLRPDKPVPQTMLPFASAEVPSVVIAVGDRCQEAVSSLGGRVRLTDDALAELTRLLGIEAR